MVLLSIKPEYVNKIISGDKLYEFRKSIFKRKVEKIYIYSTSPIQQIVGYFTVGSIIEDKPGRLWSRCKKYAGIDKNDFFEYFCDKDNGYAIAIDQLEIFDEPIDPKEKISGFVPPQSYYYFDEKVLF